MMFSPKNNGKVTNQSAFFCWWSSWGLAHLKGTGANWHESSTLTEMNWVSWRPLGMKWPPQYHEPVNVHFWCTLWKDSKGASFSELVKNAAHVTKEFTSWLEVGLKPKVGCKNWFLQRKVVLLFCCHYLRFSVNGSRIYWNPFEASIVLFFELDFIF